MKVNYCKTLTLQSGMKYGCCHADIDKDCKFYSRCISRKKPKDCKWHIHVSGLFTYVECHSEDAKLDDLSLQEIDRI